VWKLGFGGQFENWAWGLVWKLGLRVSMKIELGGQCVN